MMNAANNITIDNAKNYKKRKFKPNPLVPAPKIKRPTIEIRYLEELRIQRASSKIKKSKSPNERLIDSIREKVAVLLDDD